MKSENQSSSSSQQVALESSLMRETLFNRFQGHQPDPSGIGKIRKRWTTEENVKYLLFIEFNRVDFEETTKQKRLGLHVRTARFMGTREDTQCKTHYQKLFNKERTVAGVISHLKKGVKKSLKFNDDQLEDYLMTKGQEYGLIGT